MGAPFSLPPVPLRRELLLAAPPEDIWPLVSNTDRFNRSLGLPALTLAAAIPGDFATTVHARFYGIKLTWRELPFEWIEKRYFRSVREFDQGPLARFEGGMEIAPEGAGTRVIISSTFTPRNALGSLLIRYAIGEAAINDAQALLRRFEASLKNGSEAFPARRTKSLPHATALAHKTQALHDAPINRHVASRLLHFIDHAYDDELGRMRPFELADRWGADRFDTLRVFLHATKAGLLDMNWEILCPNCSAPEAKLSSLADVAKTSHCASCDINYSVNFDDSVELRFSVNPAVRSVETHVFCAGSPTHTPFAVAQLFVPAADDRAFDIELAAESYILRNLKSHKRVFLRPTAQGTSAVNVDLSRTEDGQELPFKPGQVRLILAPDGRTALTRLERENWKEGGATASLVTSLQEFRDLFSSEVLAPGLRIGIKTLTMMFTDLKDSTALYESIGNVSAYAIVRDHFGYLSAIVRKYNGAVVKTIGDAVMAVFSRATDAVAAAFEIQEGIDAFNHSLAPRPEVVIKLGLHQGPAIAINADGTFDYFGTTVNVAARVQSESAGGDVVLTDSLATDPTVVALLAAHRFSDKSFEIKLKGLSDVFKLRRLTPQRDGDA